MGFHGPHTAESRANISISLLGNKRRQGKEPWNKGKPYSIGRINQWKGDEASYTAKHQWAARQFGKASMCELNPEHKASRYHWASKSGLHLRDRSDWIQLCPKCHWKFDHPDGVTLTEEQKTKISKGLKRAYAEGRR